MKKIRRLIVVIASLFLLSFAGAGLVGGVVLADSANEVCNGVSQVTGGSGCGNTEENQTKINTVIINVVNILSWIVGIAAVIVVVIGGLSMVTSAGNPEKVSKARNTIIYAVAGLVIVALAQVIVHLVIGKIIFKQ